MVHLLHRLYGVDAPGLRRFYDRDYLYLTITTEFNNVTLP